MGGAKWAVREPLDEAPVARKTSSCERGRRRTRRTWPRTDSRPAAPAAACRPSWAGSPVRIASARVSATLRARPVSAAAASAPTPLAFSAPVSSAAGTPLGEVWRSPRAASPARSGSAPASATSQSGSAVWRVCPAASGEERARRQARGGADAAAEAEAGSGMWVPAHGEAPA